MTPNEAPVSRTTARATSNVVDRARASRLRSPLLAASVALAAVVACGAPGGAGPADPSRAIPSGDGSAAVGGDDPHSGGDRVDRAAHAGGGPHAPTADAMRPPSATAMASELAAIGLDPKALPPLDKLEGDKLRKVMKTFTKALGVRCESCHVEDFAAPTPKKRVAERMWNEYARGLATEAGEPLYCDSCHQGREEFLDRRDKKGLAAWMSAHYVEGLARTDGREHSCETCHGDPFEPRFLSAWGAGRRR